MVQRHYSCHVVLHTVRAGAYAQDSNMYACAFAEQTKVLKSSLGWKSEDCPDANETVDKNKNHKFGTK